MPNFENSRWRTAAILIFFSRYISAENHPISTKCCVQMQILVPITATLQNVKILQIQYGGRPPYWKSFSGYISTIYCPINAKFGMKKQDHLRHRSRDQSGRHFENGLIAISQSRIIHFQWDFVSEMTCTVLSGTLNSSIPYHFNEIWYADANFGSNNSHVAKYENFANPIWRPAAILKIVFWVYLNDLLSD